MDNMRRDLNNGYSGEEYFTATMELRWIYRENHISPTTAEQVKVLQQMWQGSGGTQEWKDVPLAEENLTK